MFTALQDLLLIIGSWHIAKCQPPVSCCTRNVELPLCLMNIPLDWKVSLIIHLLPGKWVVITSQAITLVMVNTSSVYSKTTVIHNLVENEQADLLCIIESWLGKTINVTLSEIWPFRLHQTRLGRGMTLSDVASFCSWDVQVRRPINWLVGTS